jgi:hypothetical protein
VSKGQLLLYVGKRLFVVHNKKRTIYSSKKAAASRNDKMNSNTDAEFLWATAVVTVLNTSASLFNHSSLAFVYSTAFEGLPREWAPVPSLLPTRLFRLMEQHNRAHLPAKPRPNVPTEIVEQTSNIILDGNEIASGQRRKMQWYFGSGF